MSGETGSTPASIFESLMQYRKHDVLVKALMPELSFDEKMRLVSAGLLVDPGLSGQIQYFTTVTASDGREWWFSPFGTFAVGLLSAAVTASNDESIFKFDKGKAAIPVYVLTEVGFALSTILPNHEDQVGVQYAGKLKSLLPSEHLCFWHRRIDGQWYSSARPDQ